MCLARLYVVIVCDGFIILDGILVVQNRFLFFSLTEGTDVVVNLIVGDVWLYEYELLNDLSEKLRFVIDYICKFVQCLCPWRILEQIL